MEHPARIISCYVMKSLETITEGRGDCPGRKEQNPADETEQCDDEFLLHQEECACQDGQEAYNVREAVVDHTDDDQVVDREQDAVCGRLCKCKCRHSSKRHHKSHEKTNKIATMFQELHLYPPFQYWFECLYQKPATT